MTQQPGAWIPDPEQRAALNAALHTTGAETGFWDDQGRPAPGPTTSTNGGPPPPNPSAPNPEKNPSNQPISKDQPIHHVQGLDLPVMQIS